MIIIVQERRAKVLDNFTEAIKFVEKHWPRMSKLPGYVFLGKDPPAGWRIKKAKRSDTGAYSMIGENKKKRSIWIRTFSKVDETDYYVEVLVHELRHLAQARNLTHSQFYRRYYKSKKSRERYESVADRSGEIAREYYERSTYPTGK